MSSEKEKLPFIETLYPSPIDEEWLDGYAGEDKVVTFADILRIAQERPILKIADYGFTDLDRSTEGIHEGELITISGLTKHGKTTFAQSITRHLVQQDLPVGWFSFEVPPAQFIRPFADFGKALQFGVMPKIHRAGNLRWIFHRILEMHQKWATRVFFIDHLHFLFDLWGTKNASLTIGQVVRALKHLAVTRELAIFILCHMSKGQKEGEDDTYENLRDSSLIAQESDSVFLVRRVKEDNVFTNKGVVTIEFHRRTGVMKQKVGLRKVGNFMEQAAYEEPQKEYRDPGYGGGEYRRRY